MLYWRKCPLSHSPLPLVWLISQKRPHAIHHAPMPRIHLESLPPGIAFEAQPGSQVHCYQGLEIVPSLDVLNIHHHALDPFQVSQVIEERLRERRIRRGRVEGEIFFRGVLSKTTPFPQPLSKEPLP